MPLEHVDRSRLARATKRALRWHAEQHRKGSEIPYASHLLQVAGLVLEFGGDVDQAVAGMLHDALEDAPTPAARAKRERKIEAEFGDEVLAIVLDCTDTGPEESAETKLPWRERKERFLERLPRAHAKSPLVVACDKRHNLGALVGDVRIEGLAYMDRFNAPPDDQIWYFERLIGTVQQALPKRLAAEMKALLRELRQLVREGRARAGEGI